ncbi:hypothetical protein MUP79_07000, partial [Candidatus Bathyarchaeota archaeon]|nr:hypothetical protein [Candidatus Bathyarchaeota archaeon]
VALEKGMSLVVNVSDIEDDVDQLHFVSSFLWNLYRLEQKYRRVLFLVLEEADIYAPQMWDQTSKQSLSRVSLIAKHGRKIGIFPILISQRPADLHKSPLSQCNINLFGKFTSPADLDPKTGLMFLVKKQHLEITEEQIMKLETGSFVVSDRFGVRTVAVRKRLCPHGADTPLIEPKPFAADLSNALGGLRDEIAKSIAAKKDEESVVKRLEKENVALRNTNKELQEKANIKISVKEMLSHDDSAGKQVNAQVYTLVGKDEREGFLKRLNFLERVKKDLEGRYRKMEEELKLYDELKSVFRQMFPKGIPENPFLTTNKELTSVGLQKVTKVVPLQEISLSVPSIRTDTVKGKILALARDGFFGNWQSVGDVSAKLVDDCRFNATEQEINGTLKELVVEHILGLKHTNCNRWKLAPDVVFEKEGS